MKIQDRYDLYINGEWIKPASGEYLDAINPATGEKIAEFATANNEDVDRAIEVPGNALKVNMDLSLRKNALVSYLR